MFYSNNQKRKFGQICTKKLKMLNLNNQKKTQIRTNLDL